MPEQTCATTRTPVSRDIPIDFLTFEDGLLRGILTDCAAPAPDLPTLPVWAGGVTDTAPAQFADTTR